jgi:hypothetical protein
MAAIFSRHSSPCGISLHILFVLLYVIASSSAISATFTVNSPGDSHDINAGDGIVADHVVPDSSRVTLRAAVEEASALPGPDTVLIPSSVSPIRLHLGPIIVAGAQTHLLGVDSRPIIDGLGNPLWAGSLVLASDSNSVQGLTVRRARGHGLIVTGAHNTVQDNTLIGNGVDNPTGAGIVIIGENAVANQVVGNLIGVYDNGALTDDNRIGVLIDQGASDNVLGGESEHLRNIISGNDSAGVVVSGAAHDNTITGNFIGPDITGTLLISAQRIGIVLVEGAHGNAIGAAAWPNGNLISGNASHGVALSGPDVRSNVIRGNIIGMSIIGRLRLGNGGDGVAIVDGAADNRIGDPNLAAGNFISGNDGSGVRIAGSRCEGNRIAGNFIGPDTRGIRGVGNGWIDGAGVLIEDTARYNIIGGGTEPERNVISGNVGIGVHVRGAATSDNIIAGNYIGPVSSGASYTSNAAGVVISDGAQSTLIGGSNPGDANVISGNRSDEFPLGAGVLITGAGTSWNRVSGNTIGLDATGSRAIPNGAAGVIIGEGATANTIGGATQTERNVIAGNGTEPFVPGVGGGVHLYGLGTERNCIMGNYIGLIANGTTSIGNRGSGIGIFTGASRNRIGGDSAACGNVITDSERHGIQVDGYQSRANLIRHNRIYGNDSLGIAITNSAQDRIEPPVLSSSTTSEVLGADAPPSGLMDVYVAQADPSGYGEGARLVGSARVKADGTFQVRVDGVLPGDTLTAIATDTNSNSSAFASNRLADPSSAVDDDDPAALPSDFALSQNYPNPFNPETSIRYALPQASRVDLRVYNALGQVVTHLVPGQHQPAGWHDVRWTGLTDQGQPAASGIYIYVLQVGSFHDARKMLLLK